MTGLDNIISQITQDAQAEAVKILERAGNEAEAALLRANEDGRRESDGLALRAENEAAEVLERARSAAALEKRECLLRAKQELIKEAVGEAKDALYALPADEAFALLLRLIPQRARQGQGELLLAKRDLERLPAGFAEKLSQSLPKGASLSVAKQGGDFAGGFVLVYGGVEENCAFEALFEAARDDLQDGVHRLLFA